MMKRALLPVALVLTACAPSGTGGAGSMGSSTSVIATSTAVHVRLAEESGGYAALIDADAAAVRRVMPEVFEALGIPAGLLDERGTAFGTHRFTGTRIGDRRTSSFVRCAGTGSGPSSTSGYRVRLSIRTAVESQADGRSRLLTSVGGSGTTVEGTSTAAIRCVTTGELEELIASLASRLVTPG